MRYHNFVLEHYFDLEPISVEETLEECVTMAAELEPMVADVGTLLAEYQAQGKALLFEGAQGTLLDIDHGTYPYVTSSNTTAGAAASGTGVGPRDLHYVLGITKAYTTRVGGGPFPTELSCELGDYLGERGNEFGATTGRARRCGWFDAVALRRAAQINILSGLCITKLDVLDELETIRIAVAYRYKGERLDALPSGAEALAECEAEYIDMPGWQSSTAGIQRAEDLPPAAVAYLRKLEELVGVPVDIVSTGPDRKETIIYRDPFAS